MLFTSPVYSQVSGSIAGITYFHGRSGLTTRSRSTPTNPNTERQRTIRHAIARLGSYWGQTLTNDQRDAWRLYASNVPWTNPLGQTTFLTGQQHFTRCNVPRIQASILIINDAPTTYDLGTWTRPTIEGAYEGVDIISIGFTNTDAWALHIGGFMHIYVGRPVSLSHNFFGGPYRFRSTIPGFVLPIPSPNNFASPWRLFIPNKVWVTARVIQVDGRLSPPIIIGPKAITTPPKEFLESLEDSQTDLA